MSFNSYFNVFCRFDCASLADGGKLFLAASPATTNALLPSSRRVRRMSIATHFVTSHTLDSFIYFLESEAAMVRR